MFPGAAALRILRRHFPVMQQKGRYFLTSIIFDLRKTVTYAKNLPDEFSDFDSIVIHQRQERKN